MNKDLNVVIPGILENDWSELEKKIQLVLPFAKTIHIDIIDGKFAPNTTFMDPEPFKKYTSDIPFELHMMVDEPINFLKPFSDVGFQRFIGHVEKMSDQSLFVAKAQLLGEVGLAIDSPTPIDKVVVPFSDLDVVLVMTIKAGESGQELIEADFSKIESIKDRIFIPIEIDGGINANNIAKAKSHGVSRFVATSFIFEGDPKDQYGKLKEKIS